MTILHTAADLSADDLRATADHLIKRFAEIVAESDALRKQLKRVQHHVVVVDAVNQAQARDNADLQAELRRANARCRELAEANEQLTRQLERAQQQPTRSDHTTRWPFRRIGNQL